MEILSARSSDEPAIKRLLGSAGLPIDDINAKSLESFLVARECEVVIGVVGLDLDGEIALLRSLVVAESARGHGLGNKLVMAAEALAIRCAANAIYLLTTTADRYFTSRGYAPMERALAPKAVQQMPQFRSLCPSTSVLMVKIP